MEGPPPTDPSVLDAGSNGVPVSDPCLEPHDRAEILTLYRSPRQPPPVPTETRPTPTSSAPQPRPSTHTAPTARVAHPLLSTQTPSRQSKPVPQVDLLNADFGESASSQPQPSKTTSAPTAAPGQAAQPPALESVVQTSQTAPATTSSGAGLFDLDFKPPAHGKTTSHAPTAKKSDIMSLFATPSPTTNMYNPGLAAGQPQQNQYASWSGGGTDTSVAGVPAGHRPREPSLSGGMAGLNLGGVGMSGNVWASSAVSPDIIETLSLNPFTEMP
jgi:stromal membrane-associated protein